MMNYVNAINGTMKVKTYKHRRFNANARERHRMHGLNAALDRLRSCVPLQIYNNMQNTPQKLSKIETLRLARNYIHTLSIILAEKQPMCVVRFITLITKGLSQNTTNLIVASLKLGMFRNLVYWPQDEDWNRNWYQTELNNNYNFYKSFVNTQ